jgi:hypothetical protein
MASALDADAILTAGGVLALDRPPSGPAPDVRSSALPSRPADVVEARAYQHAALPGRTILRVVASNLARGVDLEMETIGFASGGAGVQVGRERRRALGFPGWALVNDPKNARFALEVVQDLKKAARRAKSKPGHAKEAIDAIADTLHKSVPGFLPSFYEETGRAFLEADAHSYAAQYFEKAREAERVHALVIDEDTRRDAFLEFALAGAVSIKSLSAYAKDLEKSRAPAEAYAQFRRLCVQRTLGGLPPWGGMAKELTRLAKLAKLDTAAEARAVITEIIESPSLKRAPADFWASYDAAIVEVSQGSPKIRGALLALSPEPSSGVEGFDDEWIDLLERAGALDALYDASLPAEAQPSGGAAAWLSALYTHSRRGWRSRALATRIFELVTRAAPRVRAEGKPIAFVGRYGRDLDIDLTEHALALGLTIADPPPHATLDFASWAGGTEERGRDPVLLAAHPAFQAVITNGLDAVVGTQPFETVARGKKGLLAARRAWLMSAIAEASGAVPSLDAALDRIATKTSSALFAELEGSHAALSGIDTTRALAATLRGGLGGELGWPAFEDAVRELDPTGTGATTVHGIFPYVCVANATRAIAVGPRGRVVSHDLQLPKGHTLLALRCIGGALLVIFRDTSWKNRAYWSTAPSDPFELDHGHYGLGQGVGHVAAIELADGAMVEGARAMRAGDRTMPAPQIELAYDGVTIWKREFADGTFVLREVSPATGEAGRRSLPAFFESWKRDGMMLNLAGSWLYALPTGVSGSPLGSKDGLVGIRMRVRDPKSPHAASVPTRELEGIDGRRWEGALPNGGWPTALVRWPGDEHLRPISHDTRRRAYGAANGAGTTNLLNDREGRFVVWNSSLSPRDAPAVMLPLPFWHLFTPRDERGSRALRAATDDAARALLTARLESRPRATSFDDAEMRAVLARVLPDVTDARLARDVLFAVDRAAELEAKRVDLVKTRDPSAALPAARASASLLTLGAALVPLFGSHVARADGTPVLDAIAAFSTFVRRGARAEGDKTAIPTTTIPWVELPGRISAVAYVAASPATQPADRAALLSLLETWADSVLVDRDRTLTVLTTKGQAAHGPAPATPAIIEKDHAVTRQGSDFYAGGLLPYAHDPVTTLLVHTPNDAKLVLPPGMTITSSRSGVDAAMTAERLRAFVADVRANGPWTWDEAATRSLAVRTGLTRAESAVLLAGLPECSEWGQPLTAALRDLLGLKLPESKAGMASMRPLPRAIRLSVLAGAMSLDGALRTPLGHGEDDPESLVARLARAWILAKGKRATVPDALVAAANKELKGRANRPQDVLSMFASPDDAAALQNDTTWKHDASGRLTAGTPAAFTPTTAIELAAYVPWLAMSLPVGDPIRANVPRVLELLRARLAHPELLVSLATRYATPDQPGWPDAALDLVGGRVDDQTRDDGRVLARAKDRLVTYLYRPSQMKTDADWAFIESIRASSYPSLHEDPIRRVLSEGIQAIGARIAQTPVPDGGYEAHPLHSVPALVAVAGKRLSLSEDAAVLYLQTLALVAPTKKAVETWNGWKSPRYAKAAAELVKAELVLEAKRERAGRAHFLPGGWEALDTPFMPLETWKLPLYELKTQGAQVVGPLRLHLPLRPVHEIFEAAWKRVESGDLPRYEAAPDAAAKKKSKKK